MPVTKNAIARAGEQFAAARKNKIPPYNWIPPEKPPLLETPNQQEFRKSLAFCKTIDKMELEPRAGIDQPNLINGVLEFENLPHPFSVFKHVDEDNPRFAVLINNKASKDKNDAAFARLKVAFDFIVCRTARLCSEINQAVTNYAANNDDTSEAYDRARQSYIEFLKNLDDHEPKKRLERADLENGLGYGKNYRWLFIDPIIKEVKTASGSVKPLITGAIIVLRWNPNSSSSGIPIQHI